MILCVHGLLSSVCYMVIVPCLKQQAVSVYRPTHTQKLMNM